ncbi:MAG: DUF4388 domain-containing protein [Herpetosiphon sp.]|nr:DUF4388 domain-containing protein [Herpetosiphon sp.]
MALEGNLRDLSVSDLIQLVDLSKKTGMTHFKANQGGEIVEGQLYFRDGRITGATLGNLEPVEAALTFFTFHEGEFRFFEQAVPAPTITSSNEMIIMEGIDRQDRWAEIEKVIPNTSVILKLAQNPNNSSRDINLAADEWRVLTMINGKNSVAQIADRTGLGWFRTSEIVLHLLTNGLVEKKEINLAESLFPQFEDMAKQSLGNSAYVLLSEAYRKVGLEPTAAAISTEQVMAAITAFEESVRLLMGRGNATQLANRMRDKAQRVLGTR